MPATTAPKKTTGQQASKALAVAGFWITEHFANPGRDEYVHVLTNGAGRTIRYYTELGSDRFLRAAASGSWNTRRRAVHSVPALRRLLAI